LTVMLPALAERAASAARERERIVFFILL